jgi:hypothetical protein
MPKKGIATSSEKVVSADRSFTCRRVSKGKGYTVVSQKALQLEASAKPRVSVLVRCELQGECMPVPQAPAGGYTSMSNPHLDALLMGSEEVQGEGSSGSTSPANGGRAGRHTRMLEVGPFTARV